MSQPEWKLHKSTDYFAIFIDTTGVYAPEIELAEETGEDSDGDETFTIYRWSLDQQAYVTLESDDDSPALRYLVPATIARTYERMQRGENIPWPGPLPHPIPGYVEWFVSGLAGIAASIGRAKLELEIALTSDDIMERAGAYLDIAGYHGAINFDQYPLTGITADALTERWS